MFGKKNYNMTSTKYFVQQPTGVSKEEKSFWFLEPKIVMMKKYREIDDFKNKFTEICSHHSVWKLQE